VVVNVRAKALTYLRSKCNGKGKKEKQIPCEDDRKKSKSNGNGKSKKEKQILCEDDRKKSKSNDSCCYATLFR
jgi:hypothetical protein